MNEEPETTAWFAIRMGPTTYGIFDVFPSDAGRQAHLQGRVAEALMAQAADLFAGRRTSSRSTCSRRSYRAEACGASRSVDEIEPDAAGG